MTCKPTNTVSPIKLEPRPQESDLSSDTCIKILQKLRQVTLVPTTIAQIAGYFPYNVNGLNHISLSFIGVNFLNLLAQSVFGTACALFCIYNADLNEELANDWSSTEKFAYGMVFNVISLSKVVIRMSILAKRQEIQRFQTRCNTTLTKILSKFIRQTDRNCEKSLEVVNEYLVEAQKPLRYIWGLLIVLEAFVLPMMVVLALRFTSGSMDISAGRKCLVMLAMAICTFTGVLYMTFIYWLVSVLQCVQIGFKVLGKSMMNKGAEKLKLVDEINSSSQNSKDEELNTFISDYSELEDLVEHFNSTFKFHICINLLGCCSSWIMHTFILVSAGTKEGLNFGTTMMVLWVLLDSAGIIIICSASCQVTNEAKSSMNQLRDVVMKNMDTDMAYAVRAQIHLNRIITNPVWISPGNLFILNRSVIISIAAVMITYVFVFVQFQDAERRGVTDQSVQLNVHTLASL